MCPPVLEKKNVGGKRADIRDHTGTSGAAHQSGKPQGHFQTIWRYFSSVKCYP